MTRGQALEAILRGLVADLDGYRRLEALLGEHFHAALRHDSQRAAQAGDAIAALAGELEAHRAERASLARRLLRGDVRMADVFVLMNAEAREQAERAWTELERRVRDCKALNERNCRLVMDQFEIMQRVLDGEADVYVPA